MRVVNRDGKTYLEIEITSEVKKALMPLMLGELSDLLRSFANTSTVQVSPQPPPPPVEVPAEPKPAPQEPSNPQPQLRKRKGFADRQGLINPYTP